MRLHRINRYQSFLFATDVKIHASKINYELERTCGDL